MSLYGLSVFALVYMLAVASPGPGVAAIVARVLGRGTRRRACVYSGLSGRRSGLVHLRRHGLAMLAQTAYTVFVVVKFAGAAYLLYLAYRLWTAPATPLADSQQPGPRERPVQLFMGSLALTLGNPKTMVFFLAVLPTVIELKRLTVGGFFEIALVICFVLPLVLGLYAFFAGRARKHLSRPESVRWVQRGTGAVMAGAAIAVATR
jgi:threonine/homoserine/homoserine lactone efflux protein